MRRQPEPRRFIVPAAIVTGLLVLTTVAGCLVALAQLGVRI